MLNWQPKFYLNIENHTKTFRTTVKLFSSWDIQSGHHIVCSLEIFLKLLKKSFHFRNGLLRVQKRYSYIFGTVGKYKSNSFEWWVRKKILAFCWSARCWMLKITEMRWNLTANLSSHSKVIFFAKFWCTSGFRAFYQKIVGPDFWVWAVFLRNRARIFCET